MIPEIIHQTFSRRHALPSEIERCLAQNASLNSGWEHRFYTDADAQDVISALGGGSAVDLYRRIDKGYGAAKADLFRYACIYLFGGVYLDLKSVCTFPLSGALLPTDVLVLSRWNNQRYPSWGEHSELEGLGGELQQWFIIAEPGNSLIRCAFEQALENLSLYNVWKNGLGQLAVLRTTGPIAFTKCIFPRLTRDNHRMVDSWGDLGLQYDSFLSLTSRVEATGPNYRDSRRPLLIPQIVPEWAIPLYYRTTDGAISVARSVVRATRGSA